MVSPNLHNNTSFYQTSLPQYRVKPINLYICCLFSMSISSGMAAKPLLNTYSTFTSKNAGRPTEREGEDLTPTPTPAPAPTPTPAPAPAPTLALAPAPAPALALALTNGEHPTATIKSSMKKLKRTERSYKSEYINGIKVLYTNADQLTNKIELLRSRCKHEEPSAVKPKGINEGKPKNNRYPVNPAEFNLADLNYDIFENNIETDTGRALFLTIPKGMRQKYSFLSFANEEGCYLGMRG